MHMAPRVLTALLCAALLGGCALPSLENRSVSQALSDDQAAATPLGQAVAPQTDAHPGESGILALSDPREAFAARMLLAQAARRSLDVQYYIWRGDMTGTLLLEALHEAADRGVRVRLLLDDNGTNGLDDRLAALEAHPNIEVRLYNPFVLRRPKALGFLADFPRLNRRMHNKSFTADNRATIIGGRNVGDEYFGAASGVQFTDLDVLAIGAVVGDVSSDFDRYWASDSAYPLDRIVSRAAPAGALDALESDAHRIERSPEAAGYARALRELPFIHQLLRGELPLEWARTRMVSDDPRKTLGAAPAQAMLPHQLHDIVGTPRTVLELVSPYFVPTASGTASFARLARDGVRIRILTNALEATDVAVVHSGYARRREELLRAGVELYEMKGNAQGESASGPGPFGSSGSSLHAKTFAVDSQRVFVGSFNFDPRSARFNTELGFVIDSPALARRIDHAFENDIPAAAYRVCLDERGSLYWREPLPDGTAIRHDTEPGTTVWQRFIVWFVSLLPVESLL